MNIDHLTTEKRNEKTMNLDQLKPIDFVTLMNKEDQKVALAVEHELEPISNLIEQAIRKFREGGRLIYMGAGTSGRLGVLDAAECVPTFGTSNEDVIGLIAGGKSAMIEAVEGAEDDNHLGMGDLKDINLNSNDIVIGIAASGRTPYVIGGLKYANEVGALTGSISCNKDSAIGKIAHYPIDIEVGPEILTGSTRLKSGTAQKLVLNMISTGIMVGIGKVYQNLMIDVKPTNEKLVQRAVNIISQLSNVTHDEAKEFLIQSEYSVKIAIVMLHQNISKEQANQLIDRNNGFIRPILEG